MEVSMVAVGAKVAGNTISRASALLVGHGRRNLDLARPLMTLQMFQSAAIGLSSARSTRWQHSSVWRLVQASDCDNNVDGEAAMEESSSSYNSFPRASYSPQASSRIGAVQVSWNEQTLCGQSQYEHVAGQAFRGDESAPIVFPSCGMPAFSGCYFHRPTRSSGAFDISWSARWRYKKLAAYHSSQDHLRAWNCVAGSHGWEVLPRVAKTPLPLARVAKAAPAHDPVSRAAFGSGAGVRKSGIEHASVSWMPHHSLPSHHDTTRRCSWSALHTSLTTIYLRNPECCLTCSSSHLPTGVCQHGCLEHRHFTLPRPRPSSNIWASPPCLAF